MRRNRRRSRHWAGRVTASTGGRGTNIALIAALAPRWWLAYRVHGLTMAAHKLAVDAVVSMVVGVGLGAMQ